MKYNPVKIAIIEDDKPIQLMYKIKFEKYGHIVRTAENGKAGLVLVEHFRPDLVLLDLKMPVMDGAEMLQAMRSQSWGVAPHVIILTNVSRDEARQNLRLLRVDRYIVKAHHTPQQVADIAHQLLIDHQ